jgi:hypothetical protein
MKNKPVKKKRILFFFILIMLNGFALGLDLLSDVLRMKNNRLPTIILKALTMDSKENPQSRSILAELRHKSDPSKKIIVAISQKSLDQFLIDVRKFIID